MLNLLSYLFLVLAIFLLVPSAVLLLQSVAAWLPPSAPSSGVAVKPDACRVCILMPAHNEALGIEKILTSLLTQLSSQTRLLVVADNCSDNTAALVRAVAAGVHPIDVVERQHAELRGKGFALDFGVRHLAQDPPDVVLVLDADCEVEGDAIPKLVVACLQYQRPAQALYLMRNPPGVSVKGRLAEFAWVVKNWVRPLGFHRLGLPCQLMGTGMAFGWKHISQATLATGHIVEDMQLGLDLARNGAAPRFCPQALVTSYFPQSAEGIQAQRTRWEHGHMGIILSEVPTLLWQSLLQTNRTLFGMALDLCVPPLALLVLMLLTLLLASSGLWFWSGSVGGHAMRMACLSLAMVASATAIAWMRFGRDAISFMQLCAVPLYVIGKIPLYFYFLVKRQASWVRSKRDGEA